MSWVSSASIIKGWAETYFVDKLTLCLCELAVVRKREPLQGVGYLRRQLTFCGVLAGSGRRRHDGAFLLLPLSLRKSYDPSKISVCCRLDGARVAGLGYWAARLFFQFI